MNARTRAGTDYPIHFLMVSSVNHITGLTGLTPTVTISKNGAVFGAAAGAVSEIGNGWYALAGNAADRSTLGELLIHATAVGADPVDFKVDIIAQDPYATNFGMLNVSANIEQISDDATAAQNLELMYDGTGYNAANSTVGTCTTNTDMRGTDGAATAADVYAQIVTALAIDVYGEIGGVPLAASSIVDRLGWLFALARNTLTSTDALVTLRTNADGADLATAVTSDDGATFRREEWT